MAQHVLSAQCFNLRGADSGVDISTKFGDKLLCLNSNCAQNFVRYNAKIPYSTCTNFYPHKLSKIMPSRKTLQLKN
jgi:hypothetical protein